jgi:hypothetical protein
MAGRVCPQCATPLDDAVRFCTHCGVALSDTGREQAVEAVSIDARLVSCPACAASNAASRERCGRCGADLETGEPAPEDPVSPADPPAQRAGSDTSAVFAFVMILAGLAILGVLATILSARGAWFFTGSGTPDPAPSPDAVEVTVIRSSASLPPSGDVTFGPEHLLDGDPSTAWVVPAPQGDEAPWVDLQLAESAPVTRIVLWNGYQRADRFDEYARVARLRLVVDGTALSADVLDRSGPQAIDLPSPLVTGELRLEIIEVHPGARYGDVALAGLQVLGE